MISTGTGIDISKWNVIKNVNAIKQSEIDFVIMREGHGYSTDASFFDNVKKFKDSGIEIAGVYHFAYALDENSAVHEAESCIENLQKAGLKPRKGFIVFYDFEYDTVSEAKKLGVTLTKKDCNTFTKAFCKRIEEAGYTAGIYFNYDYYVNWYDHDLLDQYEKWYADWRANAQPLEGCVYHQYSSTGNVPGISGAVDMNRRYFLTMAEPPQVEHDIFKDLAKSVLKVMRDYGYDIQGIVDELMDE